MCNNCPTCGTSLMEFIPAKKTHTLQQWFDEQKSEQFSGKLLEAKEASDLLGWEWVADDKNPRCCGQDVRISSLIGSPYHAECEKCKKWMHDIEMQFGNSWVAFPPDYVDLNTPNRWVVSIPAHASGSN